MHLTTQHIGRVALALALSSLAVHTIGAEQPASADLHSPATDELLNAVATGTVTELRKAIEDGADVNARRNDAEGATALMWAAYRGNVEMVKELVGAGADVNAVDNQGHNAIDEARSRGHQDIVAILQGGQDEARQPSTRVHETEAAGPATLDGRPLAAADEGEDVSYAVCWARYGKTPKPHCGKSCRYHLSQIASKPVPMQGGELEDVAYIFELHVEERHFSNSYYALAMKSVRCASAKTPLRARAKAAREIAKLPSVGQQSRVCDDDFLDL